MKLFFIEKYVEENHFVKIKSLIFYSNFLDASNE